jgi:CHASE3 domain sensor protein
LDRKLKKRKTKSVEKINKKYNEKSSDIQENYNCEKENHNECEHFQLTNTFFMEEMNEVLSKYKQYKNETEIKLTEKDNIISD